MKIARLFRISDEEAVLRLFNKLGTASLLFAGMYLAFLVSWALSTHTGRATLSLQYTLYVFAFISWLGVSWCALVGYALAVEYQRAEQARFLGACALEALVLIGIVLLGISTYSGM